jgi:flagellin
MAFSVVTNVGSLNAQANLQKTQNGLNQAIQQLSSGLRINNSGDDAAGLAVANGFESDISTLTQGVQNANNGLSTLQIQDGALGNVSNLLNRLATLASTSASGGTTATSRSTLNAEFQTVLGEIDRESTVAGLGSSQGFSVFLSNSSGTSGTVSGTINAVTTSSLGISTLAITAQAASVTAVSTIRAAIDILGTAQGQVGSLENRLNYAITLANSQIVNNQNAEGQIRDANIAQSASNLSKYNILSQSGLASLAQANQSNAGVLSLLR